MYVYIRENEEECFALHETLQLSHFLDVSISIIIRKEFLLNSLSKV